MARRTEKARSAAARTRLKNRRGRGRGKAKKGRGKIRRIKAKKGLVAAVRRALGI